MRGLPLLQALLHSVQLIGGNARAHVLPIGNVTIVVGRIRLMPPNRTRNTHPRRSAALPGPGCRAWPACPALRHRPGPRLSGTTPRPLPCPAPRPGHNCKPRPGGSRPEMSPFSAALSYQAKACFQSSAASSRSCVAPAACAYFSPTATCAAASPPFALLSNPGSIDGACACACITANIAAMAHIQHQAHCRTRIEFIFIPTSSVRSRRRTIPEPFAQDSSLSTSAFSCSRMLL